MLLVCPFVFQVLQFRQELLPPLCGGFRVELDGDVFASAIIDPIAHGIRGLDAALSHSDIVYITEGGFELARGVVEVVQRFESLSRELVLHKPANEPKRGGWTYKYAARRVASSLVVLQDLHP